MANIVKVRIAFKGTENDINAIYNAVASENNDFDFNKVIPIPAELAELDSYEKLVAVADERAKELDSKYGYHNPYEWCEEHWGTKDNNRSEEVFGDTWAFEDECYLATSDGFPYPVLAELSKQFPNVEMDFIFADEDAGSNAGKGTFRNGEVVTGEYHLPDDSKESCEIFVELNPEYDCSIEKNGDGTFYVEILDTDEGEWDEDDEEWDEDED